MHNSELLGRFAAIETIQLSTFHFRDVEGAVPYGEQIPHSELTPHFTLKIRIAINVCFVAVRNFFVTIFRVLQSKNVPFAVDINKLRVVY